MFKRMWSDIVCAFLSYLERFIFRFLIIFSTEFENEILIFFSVVIYYVDNYSYTSWNYIISLQLIFQEKRMKLNEKERKFILYFYFKNGMKIGCISLIFGNGL